MKALIYQPRTVFVVYILVTLIATLHLLSLDRVPFGGYTWTTYNNYIIFQQSFFHLLDGKNLYVEYVPVQWDLFKYSPSFAMFMGIFAYLPTWAGLIGFNLMNTLVLFAGIRSLRFPVFTQSRILWFLLFELIISLQNVQVNALTTGLLLLSFSSFEKKQLFRAALWLSCATFIKIYGAIGFILFLFYPGKWRFVLYSCTLLLCIGLSPILLTGARELSWHYNNWANMMSADYTISYGWSIMGVLHAWFGIGLKNDIITFGILLFFLPLALKHYYHFAQFRLLFLAYMLVWMVVFNHKAESPTFIIAVTGVGIWYFSQVPATWRTCLLLFIFIFTSLSHTDIFPQSVRKDWVYPYFIKAVPCIVTCFVLLYKLLSYQQKSHPVEEHTLSNL